MIFEVFPTWYQTIYILLGIACLYSTLCYFNCWMIFNCITLHDSYTIISSLFDGHLKFYSTSHLFFFLAITVNTLVPASLCTFRNVCLEMALLGYRYSHLQWNCTWPSSAAEPPCPFIFPPTYVCSCFLVSSPILRLTSS